MTTTEQFLNFVYTPADQKHTLKSLGQPAELFELLYKRKFGLGIVAGLDFAEIRKTLVAVANEFEGYRATIELRTEDSEPLPGVTSLNLTRHKVGTAERILHNGHNQYLIILDAVDTPEKLEMAVTYASAGGMVIAPAITSSMGKTMSMVQELGQNIPRYSFAHSFTYIAQQSVTRQATDTGFTNVTLTRVNAVDEKMRNALAVCKP